MKVSNKVRLSLALMTGAVATYIILSMFVLLFDVDTSFDTGNGPVKILFFLVYLVFLAGAISTLFLGLAKLVKKYFK